MSGIQCLTDRHIPPRRLFPNDAIGFWVLAGESMEEWLNTIESRLSIVMNQGILRLGGVHHGGWWTPIFLFLDAADRMAIGEKIVLSGKSILSRKSQGFP